MLDELAECMGVEKEDLVMAMEANAEVESIHKTVYQKDGQEIQLLDKLKEQESGEDRVLERILLRELLEQLGKEERQLIYLRYFADKTQTEVGEQLGISQVQVSRMERKILEELRRQL